jgi:hypothetical protein
MKNNIKMTLAVVALAIAVASCTFFKSEKPVAEQKDAPVDTVQVAPSDTLAPVEQAPDTVDGK